MNRRAKITVLCFGMVCLFLVSLAGTARTYGETRVSVKEELVTLLALPADKIDLTETLLLISRHWDPKLDAGSLKGTLDRLEESARRQLKDHPSPKETVEILRRVIHQEGGYRYTEQLDPQGIPLNPAELFLHGLLQTRRGYCMNLSLLYLILGERLNLPLYGVPLPNHFFVRYESAEYRVNIEATEGGAAFPDSFYQQRFGVAPGSKYFMTGLNKKQTLGAYFSNVGLVLYRAARPQDAIFYLEQSAEINPQSIDALNNLGNIYSDLQQRDKSINAYERALKADPRNFSTLFNLGLAYSQARNYKKGEEALLQAAQINPGFSRTHEILARIYMAQGKNAGALLHFKILNRLQPGNLITQLNIGTLLMVMGQPDMALKIFLKMQRRHPESLEVNARIAELHYQLKEYPKAVVQYEYIIGRAPKSLQNYIQLGWVHYKMNRLDRAIEVTRRGLETATMPNRLSPLAQMNLGYFHVLSRKFEEAEQWYQKVLNTEDPGNTQAMIQDLKEGLGQYKDIPELHFFGGWILSKSEKKDDAEKWLRRYLQQAPGGTLAGRARALLKQSQASVPKNMIEIPRGFFIMGANGHGEDEQPQHKVFLDAYFIDKYEVTAADFAEFLNQADSPKKYYRGNKYSTVVLEKRYRPRAGLEHYPANNVTWFGAAAYCRWKNKRLPTEAEWEKAARGTDGRFFPWGNASASPAKARYRQNWTEEIRHKVMVPVHSMPEGKSPYGVFHLLGNVKEWVDDWYDREYYKEENHSINPKGQIGGEFKVLKGGSWRDLQSFVYASFRSNNVPSAALEDYGFRCAKSGPESSTPKRLTSLEFPFIPVMAGEQAPGGPKQ